MHTDIIQLSPIGYVRGGRTEPTDDNWDSVAAQIELDAERFSPESLLGLDNFSHILVIYHFHLAPETKIEWRARHPRGRADWPLVGIFAQRGKDRPNRLGATVCQLSKMENLTIYVRGLDAVDGSPVLDIKPYMSGFAPRGGVSEPSWARELMTHYW